MKGKEPPWNAEGFPTDYKEFPFLLGIGMKGLWVSCTTEINSLCPSNDIQTQSSERMGTRYIRETDFSPGNSNFSKDLVPNVCCRSGRE